MIHSDLNRAAWSTECNIIMLLPDCEVCGRRMDKRFLRRWNERRVCRICIQELTGDV